MTIGYNLYLIKVYTNFDSEIEALTVTGLFILNKVLKIIQGWKQLMSDSEEYEYEYDSDEQYGDSDAEMQDGNSIEIENSFYEADDCKNDEPSKSLALFLKVLQLESEREESTRKWEFKALENCVKLYCKLNNTSEMMEYMSKVLKKLDTVTKNECTESINSILDVVGTTTDRKTRSRVYELTLKALQLAHYDRLWFHTNLKLGKLYLELNDFPALLRVIEELHEACRTEEGKDDQSKASLLLEVYCLEIQYCRATNNMAKLKQIYPHTLDLDGAIADPRIMGVIREEGGKMHMMESQWLLAYNEFFEGFRNYQETGNTRAKECLKYVVLASMLASSDINPFDSREAKVYKDEPEINAMIMLRSAYETKDNRQFEAIMNNPKNRIKQDEFMHRFIEPLLRNLRSHVLYQLVNPYCRVRIERLAQEINVSEREIESLAVELINDGKLQAKIDQAKGILVLGDSRNAETTKTVDALAQWTSRLESLNQSIQDRFAITLSNY